jgi:hypothetical protein
MSVSAPAGIDTAPPAPTVPARPSRGTTSTILVMGNLVWLGWLWATLLVLLSIGLLVGAALDADLTSSVWSGAGIAWQRWVLFSAGVVLTRVFLREFVTRGITRRRLAESANVALIVLAAICGVVGAIGYSIEAVIFRWQDWAQELAGDGTFTASDLPRLAIDYALLGAVYYLCGWLVGTAYLRFQWMYATLLIPVCLVPAALVELAAGEDTRNFRIDALPEPAVLATIAIAVPVIAVTAVVASRVTRSLPLR